MAAKGPLPGPVLSFAADTVLLIHVAVAVFAVGGGFLFLLHPLWAVIHLPIALWVTLVNLADWTCPLTPLEQRLRSAAGETSYDVTWIRRYFEPVIRPFGLPRRLELTAGVSMLVWNTAVYAWILM